MTRPDPTPQELEERRRRARERKAASRARQKARRPQTPAGRAIDQCADADRALIAEYLNARSTRLLARSQESYETDLALFSLHRPSEGLLSATHTEIALWLSSNTRDPKNPDDTRAWSGRTARRKLSALQGFYDWAVREQRIAGNPAAGIEMAPSPREDPLRISVAHVEAIFAAVQHQIDRSEERERGIYLLDMLVFRMLYHWGLRVSEVTTLRVSKIRYGQNELGRDELQAFPIKKGNKIKPYPIVDEVLNAYERWMAQRAEVAVQPGHADFLCVHPWHGRRISRRRVWNRVRRFAREANLPAEVIRRISPHKLRHAIAYHLLDAGYTIAEVQALLDHAHINTTQIYVAADERARLDTIRRASHRRPSNERAAFHRGTPYTIWTSPTAVETEVSLELEWRQMR